MQTRIPAKARFIDIPSIVVMILAVALPAVVIIAT
jgi:hypothetical protein